MHATSDQILLLLKTKGPTATKAVAEAMGVTRQAARQHLERLAAEGLVAHVTERVGVGRPRRSWSLTESGHGRFPDSHAQMTVELIEAVRAEFGAGGLERLVERRERTMASGYGAALSGAAALEDRLERLAAIRRAEGYMAEWAAGADGTYLFIENHCPICAAASACQGFCRSELALFAMMLAPAQIERIEHILAGARRCAYLVTPATAPESAAGSRAPSGSPSPP